MKKVLCLAVTITLLGPVVCTNNAGTAFFGSDLEAKYLLSYTSGHRSKWLCKNCNYEKRGGPKLKKCPQCKAIDSHYLAPTWEDP